MKKKREKSLKRFSNSYFFGTLFLLFLIGGIFLGLIFLDGSITGLTIEGFSNPSDTSEWPMFLRNTNHTGYTTAEGVSNLSKAFIFNFSNVGAFTYSSPVIDNGYVYFGSEDNNLYQLNATTMEKVNNFSTGAGYSSSPAIADGYVYIGNKQGDLYQLNATTLEEIANFSKTTDTIFSSPTIYNGNLYIGINDGDFDGYVYQLNSSNISQEIANFSLSTTTWSSPTVTDDYVYLGDRWGYVYQLNTSNISQQIDKYQMSLSIYSSIVLNDRFLYVGSSDSEIYQLNASNISQIITNSSTGGNAMYSSPALGNGYIYFGDNDDYIYQLNASNVSQEISKFYVGVIHSSPAVTEDFVYIGTHDGYFYQLNASNVSQEISKFNLGGDVTFSSAVVGDSVYIGSDSGEAYLFKENYPLEVFLNSPENGSTGISTSPTLNVTVSDPEGENMNISFYNASDDSLICENNSMLNGSDVLCSWIELLSGMTYEWYVNVTDGTNTIQSQVWNFTTLYPRVLIDFVYPLGNISKLKDEFFNVTFNVTCLDANCGDINVSLNKFLQEPEKIFETNLQGEVSNQYSRDIEVDNESNIYILGDDNDYNIILLKYNKSNNYLFNLTFSSSSGEGKDIEFDSNGNYYFVGEYGGDAIIFKYDHNDNQIWNVSVSDADEFNEIELKNESVFYVVGTSSSDWYIAKYNSSGSQLWNITKGISGPGDYAYSLAIGNSGEIYVGGFYESGSYGDVKKFNSSNGVELSTISTGFLEVDDLLVDEDGNIYIGGTSSSGDYSVLKYYYNETLVWNKNLVSSGFLWDMHFSNNYLYTSGQAYSGNITAFKLNKTTGNKLWNFSEKQAFDGEGLTFDNYGNFYISGRKNNSQSYTFYFAKYSDSGFVSGIKGDTPFYTNKSSNPYLINLNENQSQLVTFWVNSTGEIGNSYGLYGYSSLSNNSLINDLTNTWNVTIVEKPNITLIKDVNESGVEDGEVQRGDNVTINATVTDIDNDVESVWVVIWEDIIGGIKIFQGFLTNIMGNLWNLDVKTNESFPIGDINYTVYANDSTGNEVNESGAFNVVNNAPQIQLNSPENDSTGISTSPTLNVKVIDTNEDLMNVSFYKYVLSNLPLETELTQAGGEIMSVYADNHYLYVGGWDTKVQVYYKNNLSLKTELTQAGNYVESVYADNDYVYVGGRDTKVQVYYKNNLSIKQNLTQAGNYVESVYADNDYVYAGGNDEKVQVYYKNNLSIKQNLTQAGGWINSIYADNTYLYTGGRDKKVQVYYKNNLSIKQNLTQAGNGVFSVYADNDYVYAGGFDNKVQVYYKNNLSLKTELTQAGNAVFSIYADDNYIYSGEGTLSSGDVQVYYKNNLSLKTELTQAGGWINSIYADNTYLYTGGYDTNVQIYNKKKGELLNTLTNIENGSDATYNWNDLDFETTYEWYVNVTDGLEMTQSQVWNFTTEKEKKDTRTGSSGGGGSPRHKCNASLINYSECKWTKCIDGKINQTCLNDCGEYVAVVENQKCIKGIAKPSPKEKRTVVSEPEEEKEITPKEPEEKGWMKFIKNYWWLSIILLILLLSLIIGAPYLKEKISKSKERKSYKSRIKGSKGTLEERREKNIRDTRNGIKDKSFVYHEYNKKD